MGRLTRTDTCSATSHIVDETVGRLTHEVRESMEHADINNRGLVELVSVSITALTPDTIMVCCLFEVGR